MAPGAKRKSALMYVGDWAANDVFVYDYRSGSSLGTLRGFDAPYGMCVDKKGDVYIANFYGGNVVEYTHGAAIAHQCLAQMRADETGAAGDEIGGSGGHRTALARIRRRANGRCVHHRMQLSERRMSHLVGVFDVS